MSADIKLSVECRIGRVRALLTAMHCIAAKADVGIDVADACEHLELMAQGEIGKIRAALGTDVLDRDC